MQDDPAAAGQAMWAGDNAARALGIELIDVSAGRSVVRMTVRPDMVNGLDVCHGGVVFTLADSAMAYSSNSFNRRAVATQAEVDWVAPGRVGMVLTATAVERHHRGRSAITDVEVVDDEGRTVALFRGRTLQTEGRIVG